MASFSVDPWIRRVICSSMQYVLALRHAHERQHGPARDLLSGHCLICNDSAGRVTIGDEPPAEFAMWKLRRRRRLHRRSAKEGPGRTHACCVALASDEKKVSVARARPCQPAGCLHASLAIRRSSVQRSLVVFSPWNTLMTRSIGVSYPHLACKSVRPINLVLLPIG